MEYLMVSISPKVVEIQTKKTEKYKGEATYLAPNLRELEL